MISLKRYLDSTSLDPVPEAAKSPLETFGAALDVLGSILSEMGNCSLDACPGIGDDLKQALERLRAELPSAKSSERLLANGEQARERLRGWGSDAARHYQLKAREVKEMLLAMAHTAESVSARDDRCASQMSAVTERLQAIGSLDDLTAIKTSVNQSAAELKTSIDQMTEEGKRVLDGLKKQVEHYQAKLEEAEKVASRDALTGASSRVYVEGQIEKRIESGSPFCVAIADIDGFKKVNDEHGHLTGDELLKQFAEELRSACRSTDVMGRWGGDEFILVLDGVMEEAIAQTDRLRKWVCGKYVVTGRQGTLELRVDASIGLAQHNVGEEMKNLLARADAAMYQEKAARR